jgi:acetyl esterase/lipase
LKILALLIRPVFAGLIFFYSLLTVVELPGVNSMLYNLSARENGAAWFLFSLIMLVLPRFGGNKWSYFVSVLFSLSSAVLFYTPVYQIHGFSGKFNYSEWFIYNSPHVKADTLEVIRNRRVNALYFEAEHPNSAEVWVILLHGGGFTGGDASHMAHLGKYFASMNIPAFSLNYSLSPESTYPNQIRELDSLLVKVRAQVRFRGFCDAPFYLLGQSAGGTIALNYAAKNPDSNLIAVINLYGITDPGFIHPESAISHANIADMVDAYKGGLGPDPISPLRNAVNIPVPVYTFHGNDDVIVPVSQATNFHKKRLSLEFYEDRLFILPGATHLFDHPLSGPSGQFLRKKLQEIVER